MNKRLLIFLPFLLLLAGVFTSCEEVEEVGKYDNWRERNEAYIDSLNLIIGGRADRIIEGAKYEGDNGDSVKLSKIPVGELFAIKDNYKSTTENSLYIYCKKISPDNPDGERPLYTQSVTTYYYGTIILGDRFDGNDTCHTKRRWRIKVRRHLGALAFRKQYAAVYCAGWTTVLQYMHTKERWILYIPYQCGYGESGYSSILGYSTLTFDMQLEAVK